MDQQIGSGRGRFKKMNLASSQPFSRSPTKVHPSLVYWVITVLLKGESILFVEDQTSLRELACEALAGEGASVIAASNGEAAIEALKHGPRFDAVVSDVFLGGQATGADVADAAEAFQPNARVVLTSGSSATELPTLPTRAQFVVKPYRIAHILALLVRQ